MMQIGDVVQCLVNLQPLKIGDQGTVTEIANARMFPIMVYFPDIQTALPMKSSELKVLK